MDKMDKIDKKIKFSSYSLITKTIVNDNTNNDTNDNTNNNKETVNKEPTLEIIEEEPIRNVDKAILYCYPNIYTKKSTIKWLGIKIDTNFYHYNYCVKLFELLMKWVKINGFFIKTNEHVLLAKFCSMMYFLSNKRAYKELEY